MDLLKNMIGGEPTKGLDVAAASMAISKIINTKGQDSNSILQALKLFLSTQEKGKNQLVDTVRDFVIGKTKLNPAAFKTIVIDEIPKNDSGKTLYKELTKYYAE